MIAKGIHFTTAPIIVPPPALPTREIGACVEFHGIVREMEGTTALDGLHYEAYQPMAQRMLHRIFDALHAVHGCDSVLFIHRLGWVPVGETSMFVRILAGHRGPALRFCAEAIDLMKQDVPIWKRSDPGRETAS
jgi:molybdopterin synthase catalytic subunit